MSVLSALESAKEFLFKLPAWLRIAWIVWFIVTSVLIALTLLTEKTQATDARFSRIEERLEIISMKLDMLLHGHRELYIRLGSLNIPRPALDLHIGWVDAVMDTIGAATLSAADPSKAAAIFEPIMEPEALVNAALRGAAVIQGITLTRSRFTEIGRRRPAYAIQLQLINKTQAPLSVIIVKGQVFENAARHRPLQNLVAAEAVTVTCGASESKIIDLPAYCLNRDLGRPEGREGRITPLKICFSFVDQISLYRAVKARVT